MLSLRKLITERNCAIALILIFILISTWLLSIPYDPMKIFIQDEPTTQTWSLLYSQGKYSIPLEEFLDKKYPAVHSVVIEKNGEYWVANEKGPGYCVLLAGLIYIGLEPFVILLLGAITAVSTYFLAKRLFNWKVAVLSTLFVMTSGDALIMLQRWGFPEYATMTFAVLGFWLAIESFYKFDCYGNSRRRSTLIHGILLGIGSGVALAFSITTRYAEVFLLIVPIVYFSAKNYKICKINFRSFIISFKILIPYIIGILIPMSLLLNYNATILGDSFKSGYNFTKVIDFQPEISTNLTTTATRDSTGGWNLLYLPENIVQLAPLFVISMSVILFAPYAFFKLKRDKTFWLFAPWFLTVFLVYIPIKWIGDVPHILANVRYFLPALPMLCICAGYVIQLVKKHTAFAICVTGMLVLGGIACAQAELGRPPQQPPIYQFFTIEQLLANPLIYKEKFVGVENASVTFIKHPDSQITLLYITDNTTLRNITVVIESAPTVPQLSINNTVNVQGLFRPGKTNPQEDINGEWEIRVRANTEDKIEKL